MHFKSNHVHINDLLKCADEIIAEAFETGEEYELAALHYQRASQLADNQKTRQRLADKANKMLRLIME